MPKLKSLNGYEITDEYARNQIADIQDRLSNIGDISGGGGNAGTGGGVIIDEDGDLWFGSTEEIEQLSRSAVAGVVYPFAGTVIPDGFLLCDGGEYSRTEYAELFEAIGTTYGEGDGSTTFNVPNLKSRTIIGESDSYALGSTGGEETHTLTVEEMPNHNHNLTNPAMVWSSETTDGVRMTPEDQRWKGSDQIGAGITSTGGSQPHNNMQPYIVMQYIISTGKGSGFSVDEIVSGINTIPLSVENGGTGSTTLEGAKESLGIADLETQVDDISAQLEDKVHKEIDFAISWSDGIWLTDAKMETLKSAKGIKFNTNSDNVFCGTLQPISISSSRVEFMCSGYFRGILIPSSYLIVFDRLVESTTADSWNLSNAYFFDWTSLNLSQEEVSTVASITKIIIQ